MSPPTPSSIVKLIQGIPSGVFRSSLSFSSLTGLIDESQKAFPAVEVRRNYSIAKAVIPDEADISRFWIPCRRRFVNGNGNGKKSKRRKRIIYGSIAAVVLLVIAGGVYAATSGGTKIDPSKLAKVEKGDLAKSVVATGKIEPITKVEIKSKASGIVKKLYVE